MVVLVNRMEGDVKCTLLTVTRDFSAAGNIIGKRQEMCISGLNGTCTLIKANAEKSIRT